MKISASIPDPLWADAQRLGDGPSDIVQNAIRAALGSAASTRPPDAVLRLDDSDRQRFRIAALQAHARMVKEYANGYRLGLWLAGTMTSDDAELLEDRAEAVEALRELLGSFAVPIDPDGSEDYYDDLTILAEYGQFEDTISLPLFLMARSTVLDPRYQDTYGFGMLPKAFDDPEQHLEAVLARAGVTDDLSGFGDGYRTLRISRRYADGIIDAMRSVWDAATASLHEDTQGALDRLDTILGGAAESSGEGEVQR